MGHYVHIHVAFACDRNEPVAALAAKHLATLHPADYYGEEPHSAEARWFLEDLAKRSGYNPGPKGGLSLWGMVGNYTDGPTFIEVLRPFWNELLSTVGDDAGGPFYFEHILVFVEHEGTERATAFEIALDDNTKALTVKEHPCPFAWMQM